MNKARLLAVAIVTFASVPLMMAQQVNATAEQNATASAGNVHVDDSANASASANAGRPEMNGAGGSSINASGGRADTSVYSEGAASAELRPVKGELENRLDSKTAKPGDKVILKTREKMRTSDGTEIPKGSRLIGHVTQVQAHEKGHAESHMGLEFDRADLRGGQSMAIHSTIESIQPNASAVAAGAMDNEEAFATPMGGGGGSMSGGAIGGGRVGGGGLLGGAAGGAAAATGGLGSDLGSTTGSAVRATGDVSGSAAANLGHGVNGAAGGAAALGAHATGIQGVMLNGEAAGSASGVLSATNKNVHLDSGTQMVLGVAAAR
ncbi:MAG TPA: hypothetical protein VH308_00975 [Terracidiphilus sp.]|nr:hypothetical protein [Terracidiphilus sp.]